MKLYYFLNIDLNILQFCDWNVRSYALFISVLNCNGCTVEKEIIAKMQALKLNLRNILFIVLTKSLFSFFNNVYQLAKVFVEFWLINFYLPSCRLRYIFTFFNNWFKNQSKLFIWKVFNSIENIVTSFKVCR